MHTNTGNTEDAEKIDNPAGNYSAEKLRGSEGTGRVCAAPPKAITSFFSKQSAAKPGNEPPPASAAAGAAKARTVSHPHPLGISHPLQEIWERRLLAIFCHIPCSSHPSLEHTLLAGSVNVHFISPVTQIRWICFSHSKILSPGCHHRTVLSCVTFGN